MTPFIYPDIRLSLVISFELLNYFRQSVNLLALLSVALLDDPLGNSALNINFKDQSSASLLLTYLLEEPSTDVNSSAHSPVLVRRHQILIRLICKHNDLHVAIGVPNKVLDNNKIALRYNDNFLALLVTNIGVGSNFLAEFSLFDI